MLPEEKIDVINDFLNYFIIELEQGILNRLESNFNLGKELLQDYEEESVKRTLHVKYVLENLLNDDELLYKYAYKED